MCVQLGGQALGPPFSGTFAWEERRRGPSVLVTHRMPRWVQCRLQCGQKDGTIALQGPGSRWAVCVVGEGEDKARRVRRMPVLGQREPLAGSWGSKPPPGTEGETTSPTNVDVK